MDLAGFVVFNLIVIALLAGALVWLFARIRRKTGLNFIPARWRNGWQQRSPRIRRWLARAVPLLEITLVLSWAVWVGREYLNFNLHLWPTGREYGLSVQSYFMWQDLAKCGACFLWNGSMNGGAPAFVELHGAPLYPLAAVSTIIWGPINASKVVILGSLIMAGLAQWWLARILNLGALPRLWGAAMAVVGGHLAGRMEAGAIGLVLSMAACSLVLPPLLKLTLTGQRRATLQLAMMLALAILAGQGYLQIGIVVCYGLPLLLLWIKNPRRPARLWREYGLAAGLALLMAAVFLVPVLHFWPNFEKDIDLTFNTAQPLGYIPLNFVIRDLTVYQSGMLQTANIPYLYINYIGWIPIVLAVLSLGVIPQACRRLAGYLWLTVGFAIFIGSAVPLRWLFAYAPALAASFRFPSFIVGLAVPSLLALAAWGLDGLLHRNWPALHFKTRQLSLKWLVLAVPLIWSIQSAYEFGSPWLTVELAPTITPNAIEALRASGAEWINVAYGNHFLLPILFEAGYKLSPAFRPWHWKNRDAPQQYLDAGFQEIPSSTPGYIGFFDGFYVRKYPTHEYAYIDTGTQHLPCRAQAHGGDIDVDCAVGAGTLFVDENNWTGWQATSDGQPVELIQGSPRLSVAGPAGPHHFEFHYRPWDVPVGSIITVIGLALCGWLWVRAPDRQQPPQPPEATEAA
jgi:hypothetical protein